MQSHKEEAPGARISNKTRVGVTYLQRKKFVHVGRQARYDISCMCIREIVPIEYSPLDFIAFLNNACLVGPIFPLSPVEPDLWRC